MGVVRVWTTADRRWRVELRDDGRYDVRFRGGLVLSRANLDQVATRLAEDQVGPDDLVEA